MKVIVKKMSTRGFYFVNVWLNRAKGILLLLSVFVDRHQNMLVRFLRLNISDQHQFSPCNINAY